MNICRMSPQHVHCQYSGSTDISCARANGMQSGWGSCLAPGFGSPLRSPGAEPCAPCRLEHGRGLHPRRSCRSVVLKRPAAGAGPLLAVCPQWSAPGFSKAMSNIAWHKMAAHLKLHQCLECVHLRPGNGGLAGRYHVVADASGMNLHNGCAHISLVSGGRSAT